MIDPEANHILVVHSGIGPDQGNTPMGFNNVGFITIDLKNMIIRGQAKAERVPDPSHAFIAGNNIREFDLATITSGTITVTNGSFRLDLTE